MNTKRTEIFCPMGIIRNIVRFHVLRAVQFNYQFGFVAVKISNEITDDLLAAKSGRAVAKEIIPQVPFFFCHISSKHSGMRKQMFVSGIIHSQNTPQSRRCRASSPQGEPF